MIYQVVLGKNGGKRFKATREEALENVRDALRVRLYQDCVFCQGYSCDSHITSFNSNLAITYGLICFASFLAEIQ